MVAGAGVEGDVRRRVGLVLLVVDVEPNSPDLDAPEKVDREQVRLLTVRPYPAVRTCWSQANRKGSLTASTYPSRH